MKVSFPTPVLLVALSAIAADNRQSVPRTAALIESSPDMAGATVSIRRTYAVRSDGSETEITQTISPHTGRVIHERRETTFADRTIVRSASTVKSKHTRHSVPANFQAYFLDAKRDGRARCLSTVGGTALRKAAGEVDGGDEIVGGYKAVKILSRNPNQPA